MKNFEKYCKNYQDIENYEKALADNFIGWHCHHRLQTWTSDGEKRLVNISADELKALDMYYNRPADELIFLTKSEHKILHNKGYLHSDETKKKIGDARRGKELSAEHKKKISNTLKGKSLSEETKNKMSEAAKIKNIGRHWYNNGKENKFCYECPDGFTKGRI